MSEDLKTIKELADEIECYKTKYSISTTKGTKRITA